MDTTAYLRRIGIDGRVDVTIESLERLQRAHLTHVPFENLDVFHGRGVETGIDWSIPKIVTRRRGGWCFELNGAFSALLGELGFTVKRLGATVLLGEAPSVAPDHLTIEVTLDRRYLVDVGFGDSFIRPLPIEVDSPHDGGTGVFRFTEDEEGTTLVFAGEGGPEPQFRFGERPFAMRDFDGSSHRLQTQPGLQWTQHPFATRLIDGGPDRVTLLDGRIKFRRAGTWTEHPVSPDEWAEHLHQWFDMTP